MTYLPTIAELRTVIGLSDLPDEHLLWIIDHTEYFEFEEGTQFVKYGDEINHMWIVLEGAASFYMIRNGQEVFFYTFENNTESGGITGLLPYSRMKTSSGNGYVIRKLRGLRMHKDHFPELEKLNPQLIQRLIAYMTDRARFFATVQLQYEKVSALGKLSAGIAHELNNPVSAISRLSAELNRRKLLDLDLTKKLLIHCVDPNHIDALGKLIISKSLSDNQVRISAKLRMEMEDTFMEYLNERNIEENPDLYDTFTTAGVTLDELDSIHKMVSEKSFGDVITWFENQLSIQKTISNLEHASERISKLVGAIKSHVHMDRTNDLQPTNVVNDIENTLMLLGHKLREKHISIERKFPENLPDVEAFVGELNQVWMNVFDNAIYAMGKNGKLTIETCVSGNNFNVKIKDDGHGIPPEILNRIFDPFFSTKKVGEGTGIGLDLVNRIIKRLNGDVKVNSKPGQTEFNICIPIKQVKSKTAVNS